MNLRRRIVKVGIGLAALLLLVGIAAVIAVQTDWFRDYVRRKIISATEDATGGRVEVASFSFSPRKLEAVVTNFVIHGREPEGAAPFVRVARVQVNLRLLTSVRRLLDISYLGVEQPQVNVLVLGDGTTNLPQPKNKADSSGTPLDTVIDLAVDRFLLSNGLLTVNSRPQPLDIRANHLHALLRFNPATRSYRGDLSLQPVYVASGRNTPVEFTLTLPVALERTRVTLENARIATAQSNLAIDGSLEDLKNPKIVGRISGHIALTDIKRLGNLPIETTRDLPAVVNVTANAAVASDRIEVNSLRIGAGRSSVEASGTLKDPQGRGALAFQANLALDELGRMMSTARPAGVIQAKGTAKIDNAGRYSVSSEVEGRNLAFSQGARRFQNINLHTAVMLDPARLDLKKMQVNALGGQFNGDASLEEFARYSVAGTLRAFNVQTILGTFGQSRLPYDASISGSIGARGDLKAASAKPSLANADLNIAPGQRGIPLSGRLHAQYSGQSDNVNVSDSYLAVPGTRLTLNGSLSSRLNIDLTSRNLDAILAAAGPHPPAVKLEGGEARFNGVVTGAMAAPHLSGRLAVTNFSVESRRFDSLGLDVDAAKSRAAVTNGAVHRGTMEATFVAAAGLNDWSPEPNQPVQATVAVRNGDLADVLALAGQPPAGYSGALSVDARIAGTIGNPTGSATLEASKGTILDQPFDRVQASVNLSDGLIAVNSASMVSGPSQVTLTADFRHPRDSLSTGQVHVRVQGNQMNLEQVRALTRSRPGVAGTMTLNADVRGTLAPQSEFLLNSVEATASAHNLRFDGQNYGDANLTASTSGSTVRYNLTSDFAGSDVRVNGSTELVKGYPTTADANIRNLPIERALAAASQSAIPAKGVLSGSAHVTGTMDNPQGSADLDLANAVLYGEPADHVRLRVSYLPRRIDIPVLDIAAAAGRIQLNGTFDHPAGDLKSGSLTFKLDNSRVDLSRVHYIQQARPGLGGIVQLAASGAAKIQRSGTPVLLSELNADLSAAGLSTQGHALGNLTLKAATNAGRLNVTLNSNIAGAEVDGRGTAQLASDYPIDAQLSFRNVSWSGLRPLVSSGPAPAPFEATTEGQIALSGPISKIEALRGSLRIPNLQVTTVQRPGRPANRAAIQNQGPIAATLEHGVVRIDSAHLVGPQTDLSASGTISLGESQPMKLNLKGNTDLAVLQEFDRDIFASGKITLSAGVSGTLSKPQVTGLLDLQNASVNYLDSPNGLSNANGQIVFNGSTATIRNLTGESGGGKVALAGFVTYSDVLRLGVRATATNVRIRPQSGVSLAISASLNLTGTTQASRATGSVTIDRLTYAPQSDFGSILSRAAPPVQSAAAPDSFLEHMRLDIRVRTSSTTSVQASLAENLQIGGDLRVRGTAARPGVVGRLTITQGELVFFGSKYRVSSGSVGFYDPLRIVPILDLSLETQAKGVNVVLNVTGPVDNMKLSYTSEPPLQFQEIVSLLASGKTPTSDPTLLANQPSQPTQSFQQMGESAIVGKALADPVASRLQRVFGISQLKIDPAFTSGSDLPQARVTLQQQVASNLTFTYVTALDDPNAQIIRVEWAFAPQWSAVANRDENGIFSINLFYKRQFR